MAQFRLNFKTAKTAKKLSKIFGFGALISLAIGILTAIISGATEGVISNIMSFGWIFMIGSVFLFVAWIYVHNEVVRFKFTVCKYCGADYSYPENVKYRVLSSRKTSGGGRQGKIRVRTYTRAELTCTCGSCGKQWVYSNEFLTGEGTTNTFGAKLTDRDYGIEDAISDYFRKKQ